MGNVFPNHFPEQVQNRKHLLVQTDHLSKCFKIERALKKV